MRAKKSLGQHFLTDSAISQRIANCLPENERDICIEVGPGLGALTDHLYTMGFNKLILVETDRELISVLSHKYPNAEIVHANFLKVDLIALTQNKPAVIIGNFPYNISSQIIFKALDSFAKIPALVGMFQKEMAQRICATPGSKAYGVISVLTQCKYHCNLLFDVDRSKFNPPPNVDSAVLRLTRKNEIDPAALSPEFKRVVKTAFGQRRKMLRNTLKPFLSKEHLEDEFYTQRPERLSIHDFLNIIEHINSIDK